MARARASGFGCARGSEQPSLSPELDAGAINGICLGSRLRSPAGCVWSMFTTGRVHAARHAAAFAEPQPRWPCLTARPHLLCDPQESGWRWGYHPISPYRPRRHLLRTARPQPKPKVGMLLEGRRVGVAAVEHGVDRRLGLGAPASASEKSRAPPHARRDEPSSRRRRD